MIPVTYVSSTAGSSSTFNVPNFTSKEEMAVVVVVVGKTTGSSWLTRRLTCTISSFSMTWISDSVDTPSSVRHSSWTTSVVVGAAAAAAGTGTDSLVGADQASSVGGEDQSLEAALGASHSLVVVGAEVVFSEIVFSEVLVVTGSDSGLGFDLRLEESKKKKISIGRCVSS